DIKAYHCRNCSYFAVSAVGIDADLSTQRFNGCSGRVRAMTATTTTVKFKPLNVSRLLVWSLFALILVIAPLIFNQGASLSILSQMGTVMIFALSYNMLLGQGGMLSFGHAVYSGLGAFFAIHAINLAANDKLPIPVTLIPLVGGLAGMLFGVL